MVITREQSLIIIRAFLMFLFLLVNILYPLQSLIAKPLEGSTEINVQLPENSLAPLDPRWAPGNHFDQEAATKFLQEEIPQNVWYKIPAWLAGKWEGKAHLNLYNKDGVTEIECRNNYSSTDIVKGSFGYFPSLDKNQWWQFCDYDFWSTSEEENYTSYFFWKYQEPVVDDIRGVKRKAWTIEFHVSKPDNIILAVFQRQDMAVYEKDSGGVIKCKDLDGRDMNSEDVIKCTEYGKYFDFNGKLLSSFCVLEYMSRYENPSIQERTASHMDAGRLLLYYLRDHSLKNEYRLIAHIIDWLVYVREEGLTPKLQVGFTAQTQKALPNKSPIYK